MSERGVFAVDRGIFDHDCFADEPFTEREAWMWLIGNAVWKDKTARVGKFVADLKRGQGAFSDRFLAEKWQWSKSRVHRFLERLKNRDMIGTQTGTGITVITINNYDDYQRVSLPERDNSEPQTGTAAGQQRDKEEAIKSIEIDDDGDRARPSTGMAGDEATEIAERLASLCGFPEPRHWPPGWCGAPMWVAKCLADGWPAPVMVAATEAVVKRKRDGPIEHFRYLEKPLAKAVAIARQPLPKVEVLTQETVVTHAQPNARNGRGNIAQALDRLIESAERGRGIEGDEGSPRLLSNG